MRVQRQSSLAATVHDASRKLRRLQIAENIRRFGPHEGWHQIGEPGEPGFAQAASRATRSNQGVALNGAPPRFFKDNDSIVWLDGLVQLDVTVAFGLFTLPEGYRPAYKTMMGMPQIGSIPAFGTVEVRSTGQVFAEGARRWRTWYRTATGGSYYGTGNGDASVSYVSSSDTVTTAPMPNPLILNLNFYNFRAAA